MLAMFRKAFLRSARCVVAGMLLAAIFAALGASDSRHYAFNLLRTSWDAEMKASSASTFGLLYLSCGSAILIWLFNAVYSRFWKEHGWKPALKEAAPQFVIGLF